MMIRIFLAAVTAGVVLAAGGALYLGAFPPNPVAHHIERTVPNDQFKTQ